MDDALVCLGEGADSFCPENKSEGGLEEWKWIRLLHIRPPAPLPEGFGQGLSLEKGDAYGCSKMVYNNSSLYYNCNRVDESMAKKLLFTD